VSAQRDSAVTEVRDDFDRLAEPLGDLRLREQGRIARRTPARL
jgi:hypothetical protein